MMCFDLYLPFAVKISDSGNMSMVPNPYWVNSKENTEYRNRVRNKGVWEWLKN